MSLTMLPKELLLIILDHLPTHAIEALALALNKSLTPPCLSFLAPIFARRRHKCIMESRFGPFRTKLQRYSAFYVDEGLWITSRKLNAYRKQLGIRNDAVLRKKGTFDPFSAFDYLKLNGDLAWWVPITARPHPGLSPQVTNPHLLELLAAAEKSDVQIPPAFIGFAANEDTMHHMLTMGSYFALGTLCRAPAALDGGAGGYVVRFAAEQMLCCFWSLYIEPGPAGRHCVLGSNTDPGAQLGFDILREDASESEVEWAWEPFCATAEERRKAVQDGVGMAMLREDEVGFEGFGFEEWLALNFFEIWIFIWVTERDKGVDKQFLGPLRRYVEYNYYHT